MGPNGRPAARLIDRDWRSGRKTLDWFEARLCQYGREMVKRWMLVYVYACIHSGFLCWLVVPHGWI